MPKSTQGPPRFVGELAESNTVQMRVRGPDGRETTVNADIIAVIDDGPGTVVHLRHESMSELTENNDNSNGRNSP